MDFWQDIGVDIPASETYAVGKDGKQGELLDQESDKTPHRLIVSGLVIPIAFADSLQRWLAGKVKQYSEALTKQGEAIGEKEG